MGLVVGMLVAVLPGLTLVMGVVLALPFTYGMPITPAIILLTAMYISGTYGGAFTSILFRIPGEPLDVPLLWDGYAMAHKGRPAKALGWTLFAALTGGLVSTAVAVAMVHPFAAFALKFDSPEYFAIILFGLTSIVALGGGSIINAFISLFLGLMIATVGVDGIYGVERFTFGVPMLADGIEYLTVMVGAYGLGEVLVRLEQGFQTPPLETGGKVGTEFPTLREVWEVKPTLARSSVLGIIMGVIPGAGATIASFVSYGVEAQYCKRRKELGSGIAEGIVAPQTASTATVAGHMVPLAHARDPGKRRDRGDPRRLPAARRAAGTAALHQGPGARLRDLRFAFRRRDRHVPDGLFRDQAADQGAVSSRSRDLGVRRAVLFHRRVLGAQQRHRPVDDRHVRHRRLPVREVQVSDRADGARLHPRHAGRELVHDQHDQLSERLDHFLHAADQRHGDGLRRHRAHVSASAPRPPGTAAPARSRARQCLEQRTLVTGVIGSDTHIVGNRILSMALEKAGYKVVSLGALTPAADFIKAAVETNADAIMVSSLYGQGELDCRGFRDLCVEAGLDRILLYVGGNLVVGKTPWPEVEARFLAMGFDRAAPPGTRIETVIEWLGRDFAAREQGLQRAEA